MIKQTLIVTVTDADDGASVQQRFDVSAPMQRHEYERMAKAITDMLAEQSARKCVNALIAPLGLERKPDDVN